MSTIYKTSVTLQYTTYSMYDIEQTTKKRENGVYYTSLFNPFIHKAFISWAKKTGVSHSKILEPFAGSNNIITMLSEIGMCKDFVSYDIYPQAPHVIFQDTIQHFPLGFKVCITNPPWMYKSSAKRRGLPFPSTHWDDLYKHCLALCLHHCDHVAMLLPASFFNTNISKKRLHSIIFIQQKLFAYTDTPVCLALFNKEAVKDTHIYLDNTKIGTLSHLQKYLPQKNMPITFNAPHGEIGLIGIDNIYSPSIRFCKGSELAHYPIRISSRSITRISGFSPSKKNITRLNKTLTQFRADTHDIFLTPFKGLRKDGHYRRRLDFSLARKLIGETIYPHL